MVRGGTRADRMAAYSRTIIAYDMKTCDECANYECDNFDGVGWCNLNKAMVLHDDPACKEFHELPDDGEKTK